MTSDADRFRPRDQGQPASPQPDPSYGSISEQTPPTPPAPDPAPPGPRVRNLAPMPMQQGPSIRPTSPPDAPQPTATPPGPWQRSMPQQPLPQQPAPPQQPPPPQHHAAPGSAPRPSAPAGYVHPHHAGRDAQLIHPAAAQASSVTPYGVPVYHAPVSALAPPPSRGLSITAMVLGLISVTFGWTLVVLPIIGLVFGILALRREPAGRPLAITGIITSIGGMLWVLLFYLLPLAGVVAAMLFAISTS
ncbi:DUF4190 domain-containing protein [Agrococcus sediminis]|nr:DUF4190 domain-containing protein [Agrococcus sediminis]